MLLIPGDHQVGAGTSFGGRGFSPTSSFLESIASQRAGCLPQRLALMGTNVGGRKFSLTVFGQAHKHNHKGRGSSATG